MTSHTNDVSKELLISNNKIRDVSRITNHWEKWRNFAKQLQPSSKISAFWIFRVQGQKTMAFWEKTVDKAHSFPPFPFPAFFLLAILSSWKGKTGSKAAYCTLVLFYGNYGSRVEIDRNEEACEKAAASSPPRAHPANRPFHFPHSRQRTLHPRQPLQRAALDNKIGLENRTYVPVWHAACQ